MTVSICSTCLARLRISIRSSTPSLSSSAASRSSFHSSSPQYAKPPSNNKKGGLKFRESVSAKMKKKPRVVPKLPAPGERRIAKRRIVLSNTNALEVQGMPDLSTENMVDTEMIGEMAGLDGKLLDFLRETKAFKTTQSWGIFRKPAVLMREESLEIGRKIQEASNGLLEQKAATPKTTRQLITGAKQAGKSLLLLQAMSMAYLNKWIVINVPDAQEFVLNTSSYLPVATKEGTDQQYAQPHLTSALLSRVAHANEAVLQKLKVSQEHPAATSSTAGLSISKEMTLKDLALAGAEDVPNAVAAWHALWKELAQSPNRPPLLIAVDGVNHWMGATKYRSTDYTPIHAHQFELIRQFVDLLFAPHQQQQLVNGGLVLAATTSSNDPSVPSFDLLLRQLAARAAGQTPTDAAFPQPAPYSAVDERVLGLFNQPASSSSSSSSSNSSSATTDVIELQGLSRREARGLLEYLAKSGILREKVSDTLVGGLWTLSGGGIAGEMERLGRRVRV